ncbi:midnolin-A [Symphorus nematophorus]
MEQQRGVCSFTPGRSACCGAAGVSTGQPTMRLSITSTTGSPVELTVPRGETVEGLRTHITQKLRLQTDRIVLLYRDRQLTAGRLLDLGVADGSKLTLVPVIEAGLVCSSARAERTIMDVLESLTEVQISDFLSGRSSLTINLGIGAHVMYVQLQLSAQNVAELQQHQDLKIHSSELQTDLPTAVKRSPFDFTQTSITGSTTSPAPQNSSDSTSSTQFSPQRPRTSFNSAAPTSHSSTTAPSVTCHLSPHQSCPPDSIHTSSPSISTPSLTAGCQHPSCPRQAATPVCSPAPTGSIPGPQSPAPATTFTERGVDAPSPTDLYKQPGAVIESFVSHSPGVFSGTFSGTLAPCSQSSISHPRSGIAIILQILNDLIRAAYHHQGAPPAHPHLRCPASNAPVSTEELSKAKSKTLLTQRTEHVSETPGEESRLLPSSTQENQALHCKLKRLQFLLHQRRLRRRTRRNLKTSHPYLHRHHRP